MYLIIKRDRQIKSDTCNEIFHILSENTSIVHLYLFLAHIRLLECLYNEIFLFKSLTFYLLWNLAPT